MAKKPVARSVESLKTLLAQVNKLAPKRSKVADGWIGDAKHMARHSDHNPEPDGTVDARDITNDPSGGCDMRKVCDAIAASKDKRISYMICNGRIMSGRKGPSPWVWRKYSGANGHYHHAHFSVLDEGQDDTTPWKIEAAFGKAAPASAKPVPVPVEPIQPKPAPTPAPASDKAIIANVQRRLKELGYNPGGDDGLLGPLTKGSILSFRNDNGLKPSDEIDADLLKALATASPRKMVPERANASASEIATKVPEANAHWWNKYLAGGGMGTGALLAVGDAIAPAKGYVDQLRDDVPPWAWFLLFAIFCGGIAYMALRGQKSSDDAYRTGERR